MPPAFRHEAVDSIRRRASPGFSGKADPTGNGRPDMVGKSYGPDHHVNTWYKG